MKTNKLLSLLALLVTITQASSTPSDYNIVFVHLGTKVPDYATIAVEQARLFNPTCPIFFIAPQHDIERLRTVLAASNVECVAAESLPKSRPHYIFSANTRLDAHWEHGFWKHASERFFYLDELIRERNLTTVFHLEYDTMIYVNLGELLPAFQRCYKGMAITFGEDSTAVPGFVYIPTPQHMQDVAQFMAEYAATGQDDGKVLAHMKNTRGPNCIDYLPVVCPEYAQKHTRFNTKEVASPIPPYYYRYAHNFNGIFDVIAFSQYLHGVSPRNGGTSSYTNTDYVFDVRLLSFGWEKDDKGRRIPYMTFEGKKYRIFNFHVHSKRLADVRS